MQARENLAHEAAKSAAEALIPKTSDRQKWWQQITEYSLIVIFAVMFVTMSLTVDHFFSIENMLGLALSISQIGMVACTMMFCLASRDFDLSIGSTVAFAGVLCAMVLNATNNTFIAIVAAVAAGAAIGFVNGAVIAYLRINALITTLATMEIVRASASSSRTARPWACRRIPSSRWAASRCSAFRCPSGSRCCASSCSA